VGSDVLFRTRLGPLNSIEVFISYAHEDAARAKALEKLLVARGKRVWRDTARLRAGERIDLAISDALRAAETVVTLWSKDSVNSDYVKHETSYAVIEGKSVTLSIPPFDHATLSSVYRPHYCDDLTAMLADPARLLRLLADVSDPTQRARLRRVDVSRLPTTFSSRLFGREKEMNGLLKAWDPGRNGEEKTNITVLDAMGGTGKTALIHHFIQEMRRTGWRGAEAVFVWSFYSQGTDIKRQGSSEQFLEKALAWFGHDGSPLPTQHDKGVRLAELVGSQRTLLVLDGLEPLQYPAGRTGGGRSPLGIAGALKEPGLAALFKQLATDNRGLLIVTTRLQIPDLKAYTAPQVQTARLERIATEPGIDLLKSLGVSGRWSELKDGVESFHGHALALTNLGRYLATHFNGDVRRRDTVPSLAGGQQERDPFRVMEAYETLFRRQIDEQAQNRRTSSGEETAAAKQLALLFVVGLFDRPADSKAIAAVLADPAIPGLTEGLTALTQQQWTTAVNALRNLGLLAPKAEGLEDDIDAHPLVREYFGERLEAGFRHAWREAHTRLWRHYKAISDASDPHTVEEMTPTAHAICHAALAGRFDAAVELYEKKIRKKISAKGLYPFNISVLLNFFEEPWCRVNAAIPETKASMLLSEAQNSLRSCGRLTEAVQALEENCAGLKSRQQWRLYIDQRVELIQLRIRLGQLKQAIIEATAALQDAEDRQILSQKADLLCFLGHAHHMNGDPTVKGGLKAAEKAFKASTAAAKGMDPSRQFSSFRQFALNEFHLDRGSKRVVETYTRRTLRAAEEELARRGIRAVALDSLSLGRLSLLEAEEELDPPSKNKHLTKAKGYIERSLVDLRNNNQLDELPRALIARASLLRQSNSFDLAEKDLLEALHIAEYFHMPLLRVDACLEAVRVELASGRTVGKVSVREHLEAAERFIEETGYDRRRQELQHLKTEALKTTRPAA
jgi:tetratricopeptide (TPR) repeat protein